MKPLHKRKGQGKRNSAKKVEKARAKLTPGQKLKLLDEKHGDGKGATKERERLKRQRRERSKELRKLGKAEATA